MKISLVLFAILEDMFPESPYDYAVEEGTTADQLMKQLAKEFPDKAGILEVTRLAHQDDYVEKQSVLKANAEYCLIPPVSGG